jgi:predicted permease
MGWSEAAHDLRFAARTLRKHPGFAAVAILTLALGIGANTAIFTLFDAILLRSLPVRDPSRLVLFSDSVSEGTLTGTPPTGRWELFSSEAYRALRDQPLGFESLAAVRSGEATVLVHAAGAPAGDQVQRAQAHLVSGNFFRVMGVGAALGRTLTEADDRPDVPPVAVVSDGYWRQRLQANPAVVGTTVILNRTAFTIVGVTPSEFFGERIRRPADFWMPLAFQPQIEMQPSILERTDYYWLAPIGRLAPGVTAARAQTAATTALQRFLTDREGSKLSADREREIRDSRVELASGASGISSLRVLYSQPLHVLLVVVGLVLLIACANVANLLLARAAARRSEISMRIALGASRGRLVRQLLTESLLLSALGAGCGILIASWLARAFTTLVVSSTTPVQPGINAPVLLFTVAIALAAGVLFGLAPALHASRVDLVAAMKTRQGGGAASGGRSRATRALVAAQIAVSLVLLVGAGLFARSLINVQAQPLGFDAEHVLLVRTNPRLAGYQPAAVAATYRLLYERLAALPGVRSVTMARYSPLGGGRSTNGAQVEGHTPGEIVALETVHVGPSYPETMGTPILQGRAIDIRDVQGGPPVAMVNQAFARRYFPQTSPIGRHFSLETSGRTQLEIVGVIGDMQFHDPTRPVEPMGFTAILQESTQFALDCEVALRTDGDPAAAARSVRQAVASVDANLPLNDPRTLTDQVSRTFNSQRLAARLVSVFGLLALTLAAVGLYGAIAQNVVQRTNEIGVRMALGAERTQVVWMILRQTCALLAVGLAVGLPASFVGSRLVSNQLFGLGAIDVLSFAGAAGVLVIVAMAAGLVPAVRATRVDPVIALRAE